MSKVGAENSNNEVNDSKNEHKLLRKGLAVALAGAVTLGAAGCSGDKVGAQAPEVNPSTTTESVNESVETPDEAKLFMIEFGGRYEDPISTYYSCEAAKTTHGSDFLVTDSYLKSYAESQYNRKEDGTPSELGFSLYGLSLDNIDTNTSIEIFNSHTSKQLSLYMNLLAKNPTADGVSAIDKQFMDYCSDTEFDTISDMAFHEDDQEIQNMMNIAKSVVDQYGSGANYTVQIAEFRTEDNTKSNFSPAKFNYNTITDDNGESLVLMQGDANIVIAVDLYNGENVSRIYHTVENTNIIYRTQPTNHGLYNSLPIISMGLIQNN